MKHWLTLIIFARNIAKKHEINDYSFAHLTLILLYHSTTHYLVKCRSRSLDLYNSEFIRISHTGSENNCETRKSLKICYLFNINQEQVYRTKILDVDELKRRISNDWATLSRTVIECDNVEWHQRLRTCVRTGGGRFEHMLYAMKMM